MASRQELQDVLMKAWNDSDFRSRLKSDPRGTLSGEGLDLPGGVDYEVHENTPGKIHLVLPNQPAAEPVEPGGECIFCGTCECTTETL